VPANVAVCSVLYPASRNRTGSGSPSRKISQPQGLCLRLAALSRPTCIGEPRTCERERRQHEGWSRPLTYGGLGERSGPSSPRLRRVSELGPFHALAAGFAIRHALRWSIARAKYVVRRRLMAAGREPRKFSQGRCRSCSACTRCRRSWPQQSSASETEREGPPTTKKAIMPKKMVVPTSRGGIGVEAGTCSLGKSESRISTSICIVTVPSLTRSTC
jgi:hypothetical protein